jgi:hypothetical protein
MKPEVQGMKILHSLVILNEMFLMFSTVSGTLHLEGRRPVRVSNLL